MKGPLYPFEYHNHQPSLHPPFNNTLSSFYAMVSFFNLRLSLSLSRARSLFQIIPLLSSAPAFSSSSLRLPVFLPPLTALAFGELLSPSVRSAVAFRCLVHN